MSNQILILEEGLWSAYSCGARLLLIETLVLAGCLAVLVFMHVFASFTRAHFRHGVATLAIDKKSASGFLIHMSMVLALAPIAASFIRTRTVLEATDTQIVETGCQFVSSYQRSMERGSIRVDYKFRRGKEDMDWLVFSQKGRDTLTARLNRSRHLKNLQTVAPDAMADYRRQLQSENKPMVF